jgi:RimJ/RimL family protein N-acetyltransferase
MNIRQFIKEDLPAVHNMLVSNTWEFFTMPLLSKTDLISRDEHYFSSTTHETLVLVDEDENVKGLIRFFDIEDSETVSALFDVYIDKEFRGKGFGTQLVKEGVALIFGKYKNLRRIEATSRFDNVSMQKVLEANGFKKEAQYRKAWKINSQQFVDTFGYGILREDVVK